MRKFCLFFKVFAVSALIASLAGCQNYLDGDEIKKQILSEIEWADESNNVKISYVSPSYQSMGSYCDSIIEIKFNKSIVPSTFVYSIKDGTHSIADNYLSPEFYSSNTLVKLRPNPENRLVLSSGDVRDIEIVIDKKLKGSDGSKFSRNDYVINVRLNSKTDDLPPEMISVSFHKKRVFDKEKTELTKKPYSEWISSGDGDDYSLNHVNSILISCKIRDNGVGAGGVKVTEELLYEVGGNPVFTKTQTSSILKFDFKSYESDSTLYEGEGLYDFNLFSDGIVKLTVQAIDANENVEDKSESFYVVKDTVLSLENRDGYTDIIPTIYTHTASDYETEMGIDASGCDINAFAGSDLFRLKWANIIDDDWYKDHSSECEKFYYVVKYGSSFDSLEYETDEFVYSPENKVTVNWEPVQYFYTDKVKIPDLSKDTYIVVTAYDEAGNGYDFSTVIPKQPEYISCGTKYDGTSEIHVVTTKEEPNDYNAKDNAVKAVMFYADKETVTSPDTDFYKYYENLDWWPPIEKGKEYYAYFQTYYSPENSYKVMVYGPVSKRFLISVSATEIAPATPVADFDRFYDEVSDKWILSAKIKDTETFKSSDYPAYYLEVKFDSDFGYKLYLMPKVNGAFSVSVPYEYKRSMGNCICKVSGSLDGHTVVGNLKEFTFNEFDDKTAKMTPRIDSKNNAGFGYKVYVSGTEEFSMANFIPDTKYKNGIEYAVDNTNDSSSRKFVYDFYEDQNGFKVYDMTCVRIASNYPLLEKLAEKAYTYVICYKFGSPIKEEEVERLPKYYGSTITTIPGYLFDEVGYYYVKVGFVEPDGSYKFCYDDVILNKYEKGVTCKAEKLEKLSTYEYNLVFSDKKGTNFNDSNYVSYFKYFCEEAGCWIVNRTDGSRSEVEDIEYGNVSMFTHYKDGVYVRCLNGPQFEKGFIKVSLGYEHDEPYIFTRSAPKYIYLDYSGTEVTGSKTNCLIETAGWDQIITDIPVYVHTLYADHDLGDDIEEWEMRGLSVNERVIRESENLYIEDTSNHVPDGHYYVTVAWFADGHTAMTKARIKK